MCDIICMRLYIYIYAYILATHTHYLSSPFIYRRDVISILCFISSSFFIDPTSED